MDPDDELKVSVLKILSSQRRCELSLLKIIQSLKKMKCTISDDITHVKQQLLSVSSVEVSKGESLLSTSARIEISFEVCKDHVMNRGSCPRGENCEDLHICKYFLLSDSCRSTTCIFCHDLNTTHNQKVLQTHGMDKLTLEDVRNIFRCPWNRCEATMPELCQNFQRNTCKNSPKCIRLHLCPDYISGSCTRGTDCKGHSILEKSVTEILEKHGLDTQRPEEEVLGDLQKLASPSSRPVPSGRRGGYPKSGRGIQRGHGQSRGMRGRGGRGGLGGVRGRGNNKEELPQNQHPYVNSQAPQPLMAIDVGYQQHQPNSWQQQADSQAVPSFFQQSQHQTPGAQGIAPPHPGAPYHQTPGAQGVAPSHPIAPYHQPPGAQGVAPSHSRAPYHQTPGAQGVAPSHPRAPYHQTPGAQGVAPSHPRPPYHQTPGAQGVAPSHEPQFVCPFPDSHGLRTPYHQPPGQWAHQHLGPSYQQDYDSQYHQHLDRDGPLHQATQKKQTKQDPKGSVEKKSDEICMQKFRKCPRGDKCVKHHRPMIYQWQHKEIELKGQQPWKDFDRATNIELETEYSDPGKECCLVAYRKGDLVRVKFEDMKGESRQTKISVRRLSTLSSNSSRMRPGMYKWATQWRWYWEDDSGTWMEYGKTGNGGYTTEANSDSIESAYQNDTHGSLDYGTTGFRYKLMFDNMMQTNISTSKERRCRRRPQLVTKEELAKRPNFDPRRKKQVCPRGWSIGQTNEEKLFKHYSKMMISNTTDEFQKIENLFHETLPTKKIVSLERIENGEKWIDFDGQREKMERRNGKPAAERQLFHGTTEETVEAIAKEGFDFRFSATRVGAIHGAGSYFARDAKYSDAYAEPSGGVKRMFVAQVLVGEFTQGDRSFRRPPAKNPDNPHDLFDSCVDDVKDPKIFVIFKLDQVYPQYIITYN